MTARLANLSEDEITRRLAHAPKRSAECPYPPGLISATLRPAAVLMPLVCTDDGWNLVFIRRTANNADPHSGQVAFPGGAFDPGDESPESTALREAREEIGVAQSQVRVLGHLSDFVTITSYLVTPVIGVIPWPYQFTLATDEVSRAFLVPIEWLADPINRLEQQRVLPPPYDPITVIYFRPFDGEVLWGASARFTTALIEALSAE